METWAAAGGRGPRVLRAQPHRGDLRAVPRLRRGSRQSQIDTSAGRPGRLASGRTLSGERRRKVADDRRRPERSGPRGHRTEHGAPAGQPGGGGAGRAGRGVRGPAVRAALLRAPGRACWARREPDPALVEALWTGALVGYVRCFSGRTGGADRRRPHRAEAGRRRRRVPRRWSRSCATTTRPGTSNPREAFSIGAAQANDGRPTGVAVVSTPRPLVDDVTVRLLGRVAYALSGLLDARMQADPGAGAGGGREADADRAQPAAAAAPLRRRDGLTGARASTSRYS